MRDGPVNVFFVGASKPCHRDMPVIKLDLHSLADKLLDHFNNRTFSQIIGSCLKAEPSETDTPLTEHQKLLDGLLDELAIAFHQRGQERDFEIEGFGQVIDGPEIFGQAGSPESKPWSQIRLRNIQL